MLKTPPITRWFFIWAVLLLATGCARMRNLPEGQNFLRKNEIALKNIDANYSISNDELLALARRGKPQSPWISVQSHRLFICK